MSSIKIQIAQQRAATNLMNEKVKELKKAEKLKKNLRHGVGISSSANATSISSSNSSNLMASKDFTSGNGLSSVLNSQNCHPVSEAFQ